MQRRNHAVMNPDALMNDMGNGSETIGGAGGRRHDPVGGGVVQVLIDSHHDIEGVFADWGSHDDSFDSCSKKRREAFSGAVFAATLQHDITIVPIGRFDGFGVTDGHGVLADVELIVAGCRGGGSAAVYGVVIKQVCAHCLVPIRLVNVSPLHICGGLPNA